MQIRHEQGKCTDACSCKSRFQKIDSGPAVRVRCRAITLTLQKHPTDRTDLTDRTDQRAVVLMSLTGKQNMTVKTRRPARKKSLPLIEIDVLRIDDEGIGIGRHQTKEVLVPGAFPGEKVTAAVEHEGQRRIIGRLHRILAPSPQRILSPCTHAADCQGCPLVCMDYAAQLRFKEEKVRDAMASIPTLKGVKIHPIWAAPHPFGYRTTAKLVFAKERGAVRIGLYRRGTHQVIDIAGCPVHHPLINRIVEVVREEVRRQDVFVYNPLSQRGLLRYLTIRISPDFNKAMVTFVTADRDFRQITHLAKWLKKKVPEVISVQQNVNTSAGNYNFGRETLKMLGTVDLIDQVGAVRLRISPTSFFQVNNEQAARIYDLVRSWARLNREESALDIYCGIGGIALHLAMDAGRVIGIEAIEEAVRNARENARMNALQNCRFLAGDAAEEMEHLGGDFPPGQIAVVNPPRGGCDGKVLEAVANLAPRTFIYVSCNPETLARDLGLMRDLGYRTIEVQPVDMFPQTPHVESVARLVPASRPFS
jgi:23S rRNA (uracil1939-C5)-methyltransferase